jgi:hypothetical protein
VTSAIDTTRTIDPVVNALGAGLMFHPACTAVGAEHGLDNGFAFYMGGRCGVIGDAPIEIVVAAAAWFHPDTVASMLAPTQAAGSPLEVAGWYAEGLAAAARSSWGAAEGLDRFCELAGRVVDAVPSGGMALFTGWRRLPRPADPAGASGVLMQILRELRGDRHIQAMAGFGPLEAVLVTSGPDRAKLFGWPAPYPDVEDLREQRRQAEEATDELMASAYGALTDDERTELVALVQSMKAATAPAST